MIEIVAEAGSVPGSRLGVRRGRRHLMWPVLLGLGVSSLSMAATAIPAVGVQIDR